METIAFGKAEKLFESVDVWRLHCFQNGYLLWMWTWLKLKSVDWQEHEAKR